jgi:APA family basic amino acid/polyamine antiporter
VTSPASSAHPRDRLRRDLGVWDATWLVVSSVIGMGIFLTPGRISALLPEPSLVLAAWAAGGLISLAGALANAELGAMFPRAGGDYVYLREAFHPAAGFLVGWLSFFVIYAGTVATLAAGFAHALGEFTPLSDATQLAVAIALVALTSLLNFIGVRTGARANNATALIKVSALFGFALVGLVGSSGAAPGPAAGREAGDSLLVAFGLALSPVLFSYLGWNASVYVASEIREPEVNVPRSLFRGLGICAGVYLLLNAAYLAALGSDALRGAPDAGRALAGAIFGERGSAIVGALVLASILGTLNATVLVGPRILYAMALDGLFFAIAEQTHARFQTPGVAIAIQALMAILILLFFEGSFQAALDATTFAILLAALADVWALFRLRARRPEWPRPYLAWGHPWVPGGYAVALAGVAAALLLRQPRQAALGLGLAALGLPAYLFFAARSGGAPRP